MPTQYASSFPADPAAYSPSDVTAGVDQALNATPVQAVESQLANPLAETVGAAGGGGAGAIPNVLSKLAGARAGIGAGIGGAFSSPTALLGAGAKFAPTALTAAGIGDILTGNRASGTEYLGSGLGMQAGKQGAAKLAQMLASRAAGGVGEAAGEAAGTGLGEAAGTGLGEAVGGLTAAAGAEAGAEGGGTLGTFLGGPVGALLGAGVGAIGGGALGYLASHLLHLKNKKATAAAATAAVQPNASSAPLSTTNLTPAQENFLASQYTAQDTAMMNAVSQLVASMPPDLQKSLGASTLSDASMENAFLQAMAADPEAILRGAQTTLGGTSLGQALVQSALGSTGSATTPPPVPAASVPGTTG